MVMYKPSGQETTQVLKNRYEFRGMLGVGSYGRVWAAHDRETGSLVAVKKIPRLFNDLTDCKRVLREICLLNRLPEHRNIVKLLDVVIEQGQSFGTFDTIYLILDVSDSDLRKILKQNVYLTEMHVLTLLYHILCGLYYIHCSGVYHRDLKPANCLVNQNCVVKICDFGLARTVDEPTQTSDSDYQNLENKAVGMKKQLTTHVVTRWYRAPELILLQPVYNQKIDVWSVGCIFGELLDMIKGNCNDSRDRSPLFPGKRCFPLSPDARDGERNNLQSRSRKDQLSYIFDFLGTPSKKDLELITREDAKAYVKLFHARLPVNLSKRYPAASNAALDLLSKMLVFNWNDRISVLEALKHPVFENIRDEQDFNFTFEKVTLPFDEYADLSESQLRYCFVKEMMRFSGDPNYENDLINSALSSNMCSSSSGKSFNRELGSNHSSLYSNNSLTNSTDRGVVNTVGNGYPAAGRVDESDLETDIHMVDELNSAEVKQKPYSAWQKPQWFIRKQVTVMNRTSSTNDVDYLNNQVNQRLMNNRSQKPDSGKKAAAEYNAGRCQNQNFGYKRDYGVNGVYNYCDNNQSSVPPHAEAQNWHGYSNYSLNEDMSYTKNSRYKPAVPTKVNQEYYRSTLYADGCKPSMNSMLMQPNVTKHGGQQYFSNSYPVGMKPAMINANIHDINSSVYNGNIDMHLHLRHNLNVDLNVRSGDVNNSGSCNLGGVTQPCHMTYSDSYKMSARPKVIASNPVNRSNFTKYGKYCNLAPGGMYANRSMITNIPAKCDRLVSLGREPDCAVSGGGDVYKKELNLDSIKSPTIDHYIGISNNTSNNTENSQNVYMKNLGKQSLMSYMPRSSGGNA